MGLVAPLEPRKVTASIRMLWAAVFIIGLLIGASLSVVIYYAQYEEPWLSYPNLPFKVTTKTVEPGHDVIFVADRYNTGPRRSYTVSRSLHCQQFAIDVLLASASVPVRAGYSEDDVPVPIPQKMTGPDGVTAIPLPPGGPCYVDGTAEVQGTIRRFLLDWRTDEFYIVAAKEVSQ